MRAGKSRKDIPRKRWGQRRSGRREGMTQENAKKKSRPYCEYLTGRDGERTGRRLVEDDEEEEEMH